MRGHKSSQVIAGQVLVDQRPSDHSQVFLNQQRNKESNLEAF